MAVDNLLAALTGRKDSFSDNLFADAVCGCSFSSPLDKMFFSYFTDAEEHEGLRALSLAATLYLSVFHCGFPQTLFRSSVTFLRENVSLCSFNCTHYDRLYSKLTAEDSVVLPLFEDAGIIVSKELVRQDIFEAFDFLTNGL